MTEDQHGAYWRLISQCSRVMGAATAAEKEEARKLIHFRAFDRHGVSAKDIDHLKMFDAFKAACLAIIKPNDLQAQVDQANMERTRLIHRINELAPEIYWRSEAKRKFGTDELEQLSTGDLTMFRNHLQARASEIVWPEPLTTQQTEPYPPYAWAPPKMEVCEAPVTAGDGDPDWNV
jgi:hypothetical protein